MFRGDKGKRDSFRVLERMTASQADAIAARWRELEEQPAQVAASMLTTRVTHTPQADQVAEAVRVLSVTRITSPGLTMSSQEIADLVGSRHDNVVVSVERLVARGVIKAPAMQELRTPMGQLTKTYVFDGEQGKRDSIIAVAQLSPEFTAKLVDRWQELEAQVAKPVANLSDAAQLRGLLLGYTEQVMQLEHKVGIQAAKIAEDAPKAKFHDKVADSEGLKPVAEVAKILGTGEKRLFKYLRKHKILISDGATRNTPYQPFLDSGRMDVKCTDYIVPETGKVKIHSQPLFTGKGLIWIQQFIEQHGRVGL